MMMIAFITWNSNLAPLIEGLCSSNPYRFEFSIFGFVTESNRRPREGQDELARGNGNAVHLEVQNLNWEDSA